AVLRFQTILAVGPSAAGSVSRAPGKAPGQIVLSNPGDHLHITQPTATLTTQRSPARGAIGVKMASPQLKQMNKRYTSIKEWLSRPDIDLATRRDIAEKVHLAASEPEAVTYAEVDAGGVPALWCIPERCDSDRVLLHSHAGGTVVTSMHTDRKALGHIA